VIFHVSLIIDIIGLRKPEIEPTFPLKYLNSLMRIRDPGWKKVGSGINIPDPPH
jgi:hypothetical protein